jgi:hypothetical protein
MAASAPANTLSVTGIGNHLSDLEGRIRALSRRTRRFSWLSWGLLFAVYLGVAVWAIIAVYVTFAIASGGGTATTSAWWDVLVLFIPGGVLLYFVVREAVMGRREFSRGTTAPSPGDRPEPEPGSAGWTETVQRCQQRLTHAKSEVEWSFVPLVLGWFALVEFAAAGVQSVLVPWGNSIFTLVDPVVAIGALLLLWPLYRYAREWVAEYQRLLDRQVGELSKLEAEFLWRFTGAGLPG